MFWNGSVCIDDTMFLFGLHSAPLLFSAVADDLFWIMQRNSEPNISTIR